MAGRLFVIGATGYIGKALLATARAGNEVLGTSTSGADGLLALRLEEPGDFEYERIQPADVVMVTAAISAPDICANEPERVRSVNVTGTSAFIEKVIARGARVIFFSSDTVYGERDSSFDEHATCDPAGEYAGMKHEVEKQFLNSPLFKTIRLSYVFSKDDKFTRYLAACAERDEEAELFQPFDRAVIHRNDVVHATVALARRWEAFPQSVINFGGAKVLGKVDMAQAIKETVLPNLKFRVSSPGEAFFKNRPRVINMQSPVLPLLLGRPARALGEAALIEFGKKSEVEL